ncbi:hypothetical protein CBR_g34140 [Chara braunii]|uniref:Uncharacterized protein n=1 Tax=Chara braunii TaxID=69332 RepID=A0A388LI60_CHABU|nr:hypothetical protein CBR_g34140 [Chara braunii]|eukprot:GBG81957.1 hypothetical protein CBR_g34140 [Chara braunii]
MSYGDAQEEGCKALLVLVEGRKALVLVSEVTSIGSAVLLNPMKSMRFVRIETRVHGVYFLKGTGEQSGWVEHEEGIREGGGRKRGGVQSFGVGFSSHKHWGCCAFEPNEGLQFIVRIGTRCSWRLFCGWEYGERFSNLAAWVGHQEGE